MTLRLKIPDRVLHSSLITHHSSLITHQDGCTRDRGANVAWVGGHAGRFYATARSLNRSSALAEVQSRRSPAPRACGVDPATTSMRMGLRACSPRMRGCSLDQGWLERDPSEVLEHDLFNEDLHRRIKRGQARLGRLDAARRIQPPRDPLRGHRHGDRPQHAHAGPRVDPQKRHVAEVGSSRSGQPKTYCPKSWRDRGLHLTSSIL